MLDSTSDSKDSFQVEAEAKDVTSNFNFSYKGGPDINFSGNIRAKEVKLLIIGVSILGALCAAMKIAEHFLAIN